MLQRIKPILAIALMAVMCREASAFSLEGAYQAWQTVRIGYQLPGDIGGVMNLGEEYRWNNPFIYYAVDRSFLDYFGQRGSEEIDKAIKVLNDLPTMSELNPDSYPLKAQRSNYRAQVLGLFDLKSIALATLMEEMGLAPPSRYVFTLRSRFIGPPGFPTNYFVVKRNFDPITFEPTSYINGDLWTYVTITEGDTTSLTINQRVDPLAYGGPVADFAGGFTFLRTGDFFTGLTRDDVGGLRYVYRTANKNVENPIVGVFGSTFGGGPILAGGGQANGSPWEPFFLSTNGNGTVVGGAPGSPWAPVLVNTNTTTGGGTTPGGGGVTPTGTNNFISIGLRGGVDKLNFVKVQYDSLLGQFVTQVLDTFTDTIVTNGASFGQTLQRIISIPDILFTADDFSGSDSTLAIGGVSRDAHWINNAVINNKNVVGDSGPGNIAPTATVPVTIIFSTVGPANLNVWPPSLDEPSGNPLSVIWGSFDGTTNEPVVYPSGTSIQDLEQQVLGGR